MVYSSWHFPLTSACQWPKIVSGIGQIRPPEMAPTEADAAGEGIRRDPVRMSRETQKSHLKKRASNHCLMPTIIVAITIDDVPEDMVYY